MLTTTQRNEALERLYNGGHPSQIVVEALSGRCAGCGFDATSCGGDGWMALQVVVPPGGPDRASLKQEYRYWQAVVADLDKREYTLRCYNCAAIELRRKRATAQRTPRAASRKVYVYNAPVLADELPENMAWAEEIAPGAEVFLRSSNGELWKYKPRERVEDVSLADSLRSVNGHGKIKDK